MKKIFHTLKYYLAINRNELIHDTEWMNHKKYAKKPDIKDHIRFHLYEISRLCKYKQRLVVWSGKRLVMVNVYRVREIFWY